MRTAIQRALKARKYYSARASAEVAFHMTDWLVDLSEFHALCVKPQGLKPSEVETILMNFLVHVPNHVAAAAKLMVDAPVTDVFGVGAVRADALKAERPTPRGLTTRSTRRTPASRGLRRKPPAAGRAR